MATFYLLPPRPVVSQALAQFLNDWLPGLPSLDHHADRLTEALHAIALQDPDVHLIFREDLPENEEPANALRDGFGAEPDDQIIELRLASSCEVYACSQRLRAVSAA